MIAQAKESRRFSDKLDVARVYELISDGLHARSEAECVEIFDRCQAAFVYAIDRLASARAKDAGFLEAFRTVTGKK